MIATKEFVLRAQIDVDALNAWIEAGWLEPADCDNEWVFAEIDLARAQLIQDMTRDLGINDEGISVALVLVDQLHSMRRMLREVVEAVLALPEESQSAVVTAVRAARGS